MFRKIIFRPLVHIQKSLIYHSCILPSLNMNARYFADDPTKKTTTTAVKEMPIDDESETEIETVSDYDSDPVPIIIDPYSGLTLPPKMPSYQTKTPMELIAQVPPIEIEGPYATCNGMYFNSDMSVADPLVIEHPKIGHPIQSLMLNTRIPYTPVICKYCGLRYVMKKKEGWVDPWEGLERPASHDHYFDR